MIKRLATALAASVCTIAIAAPAPAYAQQQSYEIMEGSLKAALDAWARQTGRQVIYRTDEVRSVRSPGARGALSADAALESILAGTGFAARSDSSGAVAIVRSGNGQPAPADDVAAGAGASAAEDSAIVVTGTRIPGSDVASPVIVRSQEQMRNNGNYTLADAVRDIPQNFGGGQNPGIGIGTPGSTNASGATTLNLRGIGGDATLTLLNGHRLAYNAQRHSVDVSVIPFGAIDRIEIVADGASALYGSDAIAGVANVILKRDHEGLDTSARLGWSTDGGNFQQQYSAVAGTTWDGGGILAAYEFNRATPIRAEQRDYAADRAPGLFLMPFLRNHNALVTGHHEIVPDLRFEFDALYNNRRMETQFSTNTNGDVFQSGAFITSTNEAFAIAPSLVLSLPSDWRLSLSGMYGEDRNDFANRQFLNFLPSFQTELCHCNSAHSVELSGDGPLFALPGGDARVAIGAGYRSSTFNQTNENFERSQGNYYAFGELNLPIVGPSQDMSGVHRLEVTAAARYENVRNVDEVITPKLGIIYAPTPDFDLRAAWGEAFRAPTLFQQFFRTNAQVIGAAARGGSGFPPNATVIYLVGGNPDLDPEKATTWTATLGVHPRALPGARLEISYFDISYQDKIVAPIAFPARSLADPIYADLVTLNPTAAQIADALAGKVFFNSIGRPFDPAEVVAIISNVNANAARHEVNGVDVSAAWEIDLRGGGSLTLTGYGSYIDSSQQLSPLQPFIDLAGEVFNPPHFRGRAGAVWTDDGLTLAAHVNHIGGVDDVRRTPPDRIEGMTTVDLTARYQNESGPPLLRGLELFASVQNLLDEEPDLLAATSFIEHPYDTSNYSPVGRFVTFGITKHW